VGNPDHRYDEWIDFVCELLNSPAADLPHHVLLRKLAASFDVCATWHHVDLPRGVIRFELSHAPPGWPPPGDEDFMLEAMPAHPLFRWFQETGDTTAMSLGRVPAAYAAPEALAMVRDYHKPVGLDQQLIMPTAMSPGVSEAYMLARSGSDFSESDLVLARRIQPLLTVLRRQCDVLAATSDAAAADLGLTGREVAVLQQLSDGLTAIAIAHRFRISVRTVNKHLEHAYRKLQASDRLSAIRAASEAGVLQLSRGRSG
jgi:DNA-binding CsgD family transcriptional regulator